MPDQIYIGNFGRGLRDDITAFNIENDAFPYLFNMYVWRQRIKRKRGTVYLGQLTRQIDSEDSPTSPWQMGQITFTPGVTYSTANLLSFVGASNGASIVPGTLNIGYNGNYYTDPNSDGNLVGSPSGTGTINYATGVINLPTNALTHGSGTFSYYPGLPVMGLRDFTSPSGLSNYPFLIAFDTKYAYQCNQKDVSTTFYSVSYYKSTGNPVIWNGSNYQQFWSTNYPSTTVNQSGAFWATNNVPGFHAGTATYASGSGTTTISITGLSYKGITLITNLIAGDKVWFNGWSGTCNQVVGTISDISGSASGNYVVTFGSSVTCSASGTVEILTNSVSGQDGIRWYDGDMTGGTGLPTSTTTGWVNFAPPLTASTVSIVGLPVDTYYLVGALAIVPYKDRLLFFSPYVQSATGNAIQLQDTVIWSWNGTPFYNSLVPNNQTYNASAYYVDQTGFGGYLSAGISQPIQTVSNNEDVLLVGFGGNGRKTRFAYTGNDLQPFLFYNINSELPSTSTFSSVTLDKGAIDIGSFGICMTDQQSAQRIDLDIPNAVFQIQKNNNGAQRVNAIRDYINEWIYFCYPVDNSGTATSNWVFPTQTFFFNYRDNTWAILYENFTCHGHYRANDVLTWATLPYKTWGEWSDPWDTGTETEYEIQVIAGNPQGFVLVKGIGTGEAFSGNISAIADNGSGLTQITSYNHCLQSRNPNTQTTDFIYIDGCLGITSLNGNAYAVIRIVDANNFVINTRFPGGSYIGGGQFSRLSQPLVQTKQFPIYWNQGRQVRLGVQRYLLDRTTGGEVTLNIYLGQDSNDPWNNPTDAGIPNGLIYSQVLFTSPEPNNLQMLVPQGSQLWHRVNTSLIGDSFQIGITLNDTQMQDIDIATDEIIIHGMQFTTYPGPLLS